MKKNKYIQVFAIVLVATALITIITFLSRESILVHREGMNISFGVPDNNYSQSAFEDTHSIEIDAYRDNKIPVRDFTNYGYASKEAFLSESNGRLPFDKVLENLMIDYDPDHTYINNEMTNICSIDQIGLTFKIPNDFSCEFFHERRDGRIGEISIPVIYSGRESRMIYVDVIETDTSIIEYYPYDGVTGIDNLEYRVVNGFESYKYVSIAMSVVEKFEMKIGSNLIIVFRIPLGFLDKHDDSNNIYKTGVLSEEYTYDKELISKVFSQIINSVNYEEKAH